MIILGASALRGGIWPADAHPLGVLYPGLAMIGFSLVAWWKGTAAGGASAAEKLKRYGAMWHSLYGAAWLMAVGLTTQAMWLGLFAVGGFAGMTLLKELSGESGRPLAYRG